MLNCAFRNWELCEYPNLPQTSRHSWMVKTCSQVGRSRCLIIAFLTNAPGTVADGYNVDYDACSLTNVKAYINSVEYHPYEDFNESFICSPCSTRITSIFKNIIMSDLTPNRVLRGNSIKSWGHLSA